MCGLCVRRDFSPNNEKGASTKVRETWLRANYFGPVPPSGGGLGPSVIPYWLRIKKTARKHPCVTYRKSWNNPSDDRSCPIVSIDFSIEQPMEAHRAENRRNLGPDCPLCNEPRFVLIVNIDKELAAIVLGHLVCIAFSGNCASRMPNLSIFP